MSDGQDAANDPNEATPNNDEGVATGTLAGIDEITNALDSLAIPPELTNGLLGASNSQPKPEPKPSRQPQQGQAPQNSSQANSTPEPPSTKKTDSATNTDTLLPTHKVTGPAAANPRRQWWLKRAWPWFQQVGIQITFALFIFFGIARLVFSWWWAWIPWAILLCFFVIYQAVRGRRDS